MKLTWNGDCCGHKMDSFRVILYCSTVAIDMNRYCNKIKNSAMLVIGSCPYRISPNTCRLVIWSNVENADTSEGLVQISAFWRCPLGFVISVSMICSMSFSMSFATGCHALIPSIISSIALEVKG